MISDEYQKTIKALMGSEYYSVLNGKDNKLFKVDITNKSAEWVRLQFVMDILGRPGTRNSSWQVLPARTAYRPDIPKVRFFDETQQMTCLNLYQPPGYRELNYWDVKALNVANSIEKTTKTIEDFKQLPKSYVTYLSHLCNYDDASLSYLLDWLSVAVDQNNRNITSLVLISAEGTGKGVFFDYILTPLFGHTNVVQVKGKDALESRFNNQFMNKQIIFFDEVEVKTTAAINRFKVLANPTIEIEAKGQDPFNVKNWANTILTSNDLDSINLSAGNRRYSIIHTTDKRLDETASMSEFETVGALVEDMQKEANIKTLYDFLSSHKPAHSMNYAFESKSKSSEIKEASLSEWELQALQIAADEFYKTNQECEIYLTDLQEKLFLSGTMKKPGRKVVERLCKKFPTLLSYKWDNINKKIKIKITGAYEPQFGGH